ncbi:2-oxoglutarate dehydrogenase, E2 component, dihydrolipoamide succinyltransferase [Ornithinimicrobium sediminis]|uniref:2-oxoglutarate dehydrogenase, E2 component, dihydrolipoamide succinyltransferase n=1 Tax=Ornithinimicrobium sediminis TaxID=2904603 RepID=UPI001E515611|nr:2-oxoglutarate dehydrogenase, E2 component, dihydrolipoamide succinyltransferase [Ornithinimicrobium sediminis]MCE0488056.1 2-oxoglutarate dehydrogenase, E2 component, dihydrolipoamide succinyltransferase [Ornithinimicrobium sediminis]
MSERVSMPALGESVTEGTVTRWLKSVGDQVEVDEPLVEVSTDKVDTEIPSPVAGTLQEILADEDDTVEVGGDLCVIGEGEAEPSDSSGEDDADTGDADEGDDEEGGSDEAGQAEEEPAEKAAPQEKADQAEESADEAVSEDTDGGKQSSGSSGGGGGDGETVTMPALGESVTEGTVTRWLKSEGDEVEVDEPLLEVSTDKVDTEIPSPVAGVLSKILVDEDEVVEVGGDLCVIGGEAGGGSGGDSASEEKPEQEEQPEADEDEDDLASEQRLQDEAGEEAAAKSEAPGSQDKESDEEPKDKEPKQEKPKEEPKQQAPKDEPKQEPKDEKKDEPSGDTGKDVSAYVTPLVRKLAAQHNVDLSSLEGTGVGGRIRKQDVIDAAKKAEAAAKEPEPAAAPAKEEKPAASAPAASPDVAAKRGKSEKMSRLRKVIATRMVESLQTSAQLTTVIEVDVTKVARLRGKHKNDFFEREGVKLSFMPFFAMAAVEALKQHPNVNASVDGDQVVYHAQENLGVAVDTERGLLVPVIKDAGDLNIAGLARKIADLAERTRTNKITPDELGGGTFTLTNTGSRGALFDTPILNQPQVGILGTGAVVRRPVVVVDEDGGETIAIRSMVYLALTYDHRLVDGADAARFLGTMKERLEEATFEV